MPSLLLAARNLAADRARIGLTVTATGLSVALILLLAGFVNGIDLQVSVYLDNEPGSIVVAQPGVTNLLGASSRLPSGSLDQIRSTPGVAKAIPIVTQFVILDIGSRKQPVYLVGYDPALGGGPWQLASGNTGSSGDAVVDQVLARRHGLRVGDEMTILGRAFRISGLSAGTASFMTSYVFVRASDLEPLVGGASEPSYVLVTRAAGTTPDELASRLRASTGLSVVPKVAMAQNDRDLLARVFRMPLVLMAGIAFGVGIAVVGLVMYAATMERRREYGALKAVGASNRHLYLTVFLQGLVAAVSGALLGVLVALGAAQIIMAAAPQLLVSLSAASAGLAVAAGLAIAVAGSVVPAAALGRLAPAEVMR